MKHALFSKKFLRMWTVPLKTVWVTTLANWNGSAVITVTLTTQAVSPATEDAKTLFTGKLLGPFPVAGDTLWRLWHKDDISKDGIASCGSLETWYSWTPEAMDLASVGLTYRGCHWILVPHVFKNKKVPKSAFLPSRGQTTPFPSLTGLKNSSKHLLPGRVEVPCSSQVCPRMHWKWIPNGYENFIVRNDR